MANYYDYITGQGVIVPDTSVILSEIQDEFKAVFGEDLDLSETTPQGRLIELMQRNRTFCIQICALVSNMLNLNRATGFVLDDLGSLFLIERQSASPTRTTVELGGVPGTIIPAGTRLQTTDGDIFTSEDQVTIGSSGSVMVQYRSVELGEIPCPANTLTTILDSVNGLETAVNPSAPTLGTPLESDTAFRERIKQSLNVNSIAILSAIKSNLMTVNGVKDSWCYDNFTDSAQVKDTITVPAHSLLACVDGGNDMDVARVLYQKKTIGTGYITSSPTLVTKTVTDEAYGNEYTVRFMRPIETAIDVKIKVLKQAYSGADLRTAVKNAIMQWYNGEVDGVDGIKIGKDVSPFEIAAAVSVLLPDVFIDYVKVATHGQTPTAETLAIAEVHKATLVATNITVLLDGEE